MSDDLIRSFDEDHSVEPEPSRDSIEERDADRHETHSDSGEHGQDSSPPEDTHFFEPEPRDVELERAFSDVASEPVGDFSEENSEAEQHDFSPLEETHASMPELEDAELDQSFSGAMPERVTFEAELSESSLDSDDVKAEPLSLVETAPMEDISLPHGVEQTLELADQFDGFPVAVEESNGDALRIDKSVAQTDELEQAFDAVSFSEPAGSAVELTERNLFSEPETPADVISDHTSLEDLEEAFDAVLPLNESAEDVSNPEPESDQSQVEPVQEESSRGYVVIHRHLGGFSAKGGISLEEAERLYAEYMEERQPKAVATLEEKPSERETEEVPFLGKTPQDSVPLDSAGDDSAEPEVDMHQPNGEGEESIELVSPASDPRENGPHLVESAEAVPEELNLAEGHFIRPEADTQDEIPAATVTTDGETGRLLGEVSEYDVGDWERETLTAVRACPERAFEEISYRTDIPEAVKEVLEETMLNDVPPSHLAGIVDCEVLVVDEAQGVTGEIRSLPDGKLHLSLYISPDADPEWVREFLCKRIGAHVERLLRTGCLDGINDWREINHRITQDALVSRDVENGSKDAFVTLYSLNRINSPQLKAEYTSEEPYSFFQDLENAAINNAEN